MGPGAGDAITEGPRVAVDLGRGGGQIGEGHLANQAVNREATQLWALRQPSTAHRWSGIDGIQRLEP